MTTSSLSIGELEANYPLYCKALKMLIGKTKRAGTASHICWHRLRLLLARCPGSTSLGEADVDDQSDLSNNGSVWGRCSD